MNDTTEEAIASPPPDRNPADPFLVVGIGASAGGIQALQTFFGKVPRDSGMAYVVILHLSPDHDSELAHVLQSVCEIPVTQVREKVRVERNHVYVVSPDEHLTLVDGHIHVAPNTTMQDRRAPVDIFFRTLAESHQSRAVCVVLSGTGANGSMGLKSVKERGGAAFVQNPREAEWDEMPRSSIATGLVDAVLPVAEIPERIMLYKQSLGQAPIEIDAERRPGEHQQALREIFTLLRTRTGHDFSNYKRPTLLRRIQRRVNVCALTSVNDYAVYMRANPNETHALFKDLLISVTNFFRDADTFDYLSTEIIPRVLEGKDTNDQVRIWVIGCATGEEAYSIAMLCAEHTLGVANAPNVQIFATDIDVAAISVARAGKYSLNDAADVSPERLRRFFTPDGEDFRIRREIREMVLFANHNVLKDPPFSHLDLVTCRNVLIYLDDLAQERVLETAHFSLNPGGFLLLGKSESVDKASDLYATVAREHHLYQGRTAASRHFPIAERPDTFRERLDVPPPLQPPPRGFEEHISYSTLHQQLLEQYAPPSVVVNEDYEVVHISPSAGRYLHVAGGEPSNNLLKLVRQDLRLEVRTALYQAAQRKANVEARGIEISTDGRAETVNIHVRPVLAESDTARGFALVLFEPSSEPRSDEEQILTSAEPMARQLEEELIRVKAQLRATNEQHEIQSEELKASNEELHALNEELRSAAEELETSREELQSINEELTTVNQELNVKIDEVSRASNNLQNLVNSTDVGTIFLDRRFRVNLFSPAVRRIFNLLASDVGRSLSDITSRLLSVDIVADARVVLDRLHTIEREVQTTDARTYLMRLSPYRTEEDRIEGVVITFTDITERKRAEETLAADLTDTALLRELGARLVREDDAMTVYEDILSTAIALSRADAGTFQVLDEDTAELVLLASQGFPESFVEHFRRVDASSNTACGLALAKNQRIFIDFDAPGNELDATAQEHIAVGMLCAQATPLISRSGNVIGMFTTHWRKRHQSADRELGFLDLLVRQAADLIDQRRAQESLRESDERFRTLVQNVHDYAIFSVDPQGAIAEWTEGAERVTGYSAGEAVGHHMAMLYASEDIQAGVPEQELRRARETGRAESDGWRLRKNGERVRVNEIVTAVRDGSGALVGFTKISRDITEREHAVATQRAVEERLRLTLESVTDYAIFTMDASGHIDTWPPGAQRTFGFTEAEAIGQPADIIFTPEDRADRAPEREQRTARERGRAADERWHIRKDGTRIYMSGVLVPLRQAGMLTGYAKIARDLTEQKQAEERLRLAHEQLESRVQERTRELAAANETLRQEVFERQRVEDARVFLLRQLVNAQEAERRRISRELHDQLGQQVSALGLKLAMLKDDKDLRTPVRHELETLEALVQQLDSDLEFLVWELRPTALDDLGLIDALSDYAANWSKHFGVHVEFDAALPAGRLEPEIETVLYRMTQEALNNVAKHAQAGIVWIRLTREGDDVALTVSDDGIGFDDRQPFGTGAKGLGLVGMRERAALGGGSVRIKSAPGEGTQIYLRMPAQKRSHDPQQAREDAFGERRPRRNDPDGQS